MWDPISIDASTSICRSESERFFNAIRRTTRSPHAVHNSGQLDLCLSTTFPVIRYNAHVC